MIAAYSATSQARVNAALETLFIAPGPELARLYEAMRYSVMNGGKRVRPLLAYADLEEVNIGHAIVGRALMVGMKEAVRDMVSLLERS